MENNSFQNSLPKLTGKSNYREWRFRADLAIRQIKLMKKKSNEDLEVRTQSVIVNSLSDKIISNIMNCETVEDMMTKLDSLYGYKKDDLDKFQLEFQNYEYDNSISFLENYSHLEVIKQKIDELDENPMTESTFRTRLLNCLPKRFDHLKSAIKLVKDIDLDDLVEAVSSEDDRLQREYNERKKMNSKKTSLALVSTITCFKCNSLGHKAKECKQMPSTSSSNNQPEKKPEEKIMCKYCKVAGHEIKNCPELEKRKNAVCQSCNEKGHYAKNCPKKTSTTLACMGMVEGKNIDKKIWVLDTACTAHVCNNEKYFQKLEPVKAEILVGDNELVNVKFSGKIEAILEPQVCNLEFNNVLLNKSSPVNLVSVIRLLENNWKVKEITKKRFTLEKCGIELVGTLNEFNLWQLPISPVSSFSSVSGDRGDNLACLSLVDWHSRFAHQNFEYSRELLNHLEIKYEKLPKDYKCEDCVKGKIA